MGGVSRDLVLYAFKPFEPAKDPYLSRRGWTLLPTVGPGYHVIAYTSKSDAERVQPRKLEFTESRPPDLF